MAASVLDIRGLSYRYPGADRDALRDLAFTVEEGEIFGFLGPNGSGKSTTQKLLTGILHGYEGGIEVFGRDLQEQGSDYYNSIGVSFEFPNLYEKLTAEENLEFYGAFFEGSTENAADVLKRLDLPVGDRRIAGQWSKGMKMRLTLARSLVNKPRLWFLDEPTTGQDPQHAVLIRKLIRERADAGASVFLTTHDMTVADELCDRVAFLVDGTIVLVDAPRKLKLAHTSHVARVEHHEGGEGGEVMSHDFDLDEAAQKKSFLDFLRDHDIDTIHSLLELEWHGFERSLHDELAEISPPIEYAENRDRLADDSEAYPVGRRDELAIFPNADPPELGHDPRALREAKQAVDSGNELEIEVLGGVSARRHRDVVENVIEIADRVRGPNELEMLTHREAFSVSFRSDDVPSPGSHLCLRQSHPHRRRGSAVVEAPRVRARSSPRPPARLSLCHSV